MIRSVTCTRRARGRQGTPSTRATRSAASSSRSSSRSRWSSRRSMSARSERLDRQPVGEVEGGQRPALVVDHRDESAGVVRGGGLCTLQTRSGDVDLTSTPSLDTTMSVPGSARSRAPRAQRARPCSNSPARSSSRPFPFGALTRRRSPGTRPAADRSHTVSQASASSPRVSVSSCGSVLVRPMIGMKFWSPRPARHDVLVQVRRDAGAGDRALVHADVEAVRAATRADHAHRPLGECADLGGLLVGGSV